MDTLLVQNLRYKLQKRVRRLNSASPEIFVLTLKQFLGFLENNLTLRGVKEHLLSSYPNISEIVDRIQKGESLIGEDDAESAAIGYEVLYKISNAQRGSSLLFTFSRPFGQQSKLSECLEVVRDVFLEPFYEYFDEQLDEQRAILSLLYRYKHRSEWFYKNRLWEISQEETRKAEKNLALDLYSYLHDQGFDFSIESSSIDGSIDLISTQNSADPILADAKIFDGDSRGKNYLCKGFNQIYTYTQQHNEAFGYLIIFKVTDRDLRFSLSTDFGNVPVVNYNHKTIFLITIDIYLHLKPVSQRSPINAIEIKEEDLIRSVEDKNP